MHLQIWITLRLRGLSLTISRNPYHRQSELLQRLTIAVGDTVPPPRDESPSSGPLRGGAKRRGWPDHNRRARAQARRSRPFPFLIIRLPLSVALLLGLTVAEASETVRRPPRQCSLTSHLCI